MTGEKRVGPEPADGRRGPLAPLHLLAAVTCGTWIAAVVATFRSGTWIWASAFGLFAICCGITVGAIAFLRRRGADRARLLGAAALWIAVGLLVSNHLASRWIERQRLWGGFRPDALTGWYPEPDLDRHPLAFGDGTYLASTDELGHRNRLDYPADRVLPVVVQGDSNVFGFGLSDDQTLGARLNARDPAGGYYNVGVPGFDVHQFYFQYRRLAATFEVGTRVILFNARNDFTMSALSTAYLLKRPYLAVEGREIVEVTGNVAPIPVQGYGSFFIDKFAGHDALISDPANAWAELYPEPLLRIPLVRQLIGTLHPKLGGVPARFRRSERLELAAPAWLLLPPAAWPEPFRTFAGDFAAIVGRLERQDPETVIFLFPFREQVVEAELAELEARLIAAGSRADQIDRQAFGRWLGEVAGRVGVDFVDLTPDFLAVADRERLFQPDGHLSAAGIELCAERIVEWRSESE